MSNQFSPLMPGDAVFYVGSRFKQDLTSKDGKPIKGWVDAPVHNQENTYVVWFPEAKDSDYVIHASLLTKARPPKIEKVQGGPIVEHMPNRRRKNEEE